MNVNRSDLTRIVVAVDPATTSGDDADETGIIVVGRGPHQPETCRIDRCTAHGYVLADRSCRMTPDGWARRAVAAYDEFSADRVVAEGNQGGEMVENVLRTVRPGLPIKRVHARLGKRTRAEPIAALYEQGRCHHVGPGTEFSLLEDQLTSWTPDSGESPDRLDALVWGLTELGLAGGTGEAWLEAWRQMAPGAKPAVSEPAPAVAAGPPVCAPGKTHFWDRFGCVHCGAPRTEAA